MRKIFMVACVLAGFVVSSVFAGEIVVGTNAEFMPFEFTNSDREIVGYDIDIINAVAKEAGFTVMMRNQAFDTLIEGLESGRLDAVISGMTITDVRRNRVDFSESYYNAAQVIVVQDTTSGITTLDDIKDKKVGVQLGTTGDLMAREAMGEQNPDLKKFRKYNEVFTELKLGRIDAIVVDLPVANAYLKKLTGLKISSDVMSEEEYGIAVKKGNTDLLTKIDSGLKKIRENGVYDQITAKWFQD